MESYFGRFGLLLKFDGGLTLYFSRVSPAGDVYDMRLSADFNSIADLKKRLSEVGLQESIADTETKCTVTEDQLTKLGFAVPVELRQPPAKDNQ